MRFTEVRLKLRRFFRKYRTIIIFCFLVWAVIFCINMYLKNTPKPKVAETTYKPHVSVMDSQTKTPSSVAKKAEEQVEEYVKACNNSEFDVAFNMLSEDCRRYEFHNSLENFMEYLYTKMPTQKKYSIQSYSNISIDNNNLYIYEVKYFDDFLATGLTNQEYLYTTEKIIFKKTKTGEQEMSVGNYIYHTDIKSVSENNYLKIDVIDKLVNYSIETYQVKFTNRSDYTIVIADGFEENEIELQLPSEIRQRSDTNQKIVLKPKESLTTRFTFSKFVDDGDKSESLLFPNIRVMEKYSGSYADKEILKSEVDNAIAKFSMTVGL